MLVPERSPCVPWSLLCLLLEFLFFVTFSLQYLLASAHGMFWCLTRHGKSSNSPLDASTFGTDAASVIRFSHTWWNVSVCVRVAMPCPLGLDCRLASKGRGSVTEFPHFLSPRRSSTTIALTYPIMLYAKLSLLTLSLSLIMAALPGMAANDGTTSTEDATHSSLVKRAGGLCYTKTSCGGSATTISSENYFSGCQSVKFDTNVYWCQDCKTPTKNCPSYYGGICENGQSGCFRTAP